MTREEFERIKRGDVLRWTKGEPAHLGLVTRAKGVSTSIDITWEDGRRENYDARDACNLEHG